VPIVSTTIGAEGIAVREGENILIADAPDQFAGSVVQVLDDPDLQARLRATGRRWVEEQYDWRRVYGAWDDVYARLIEAVSP
jgi:glycosyltransferase involved in cell wall biosynthesis